jgi:tRNA G18 (ribose-2'-O)-methylase SpoU
MGSFQWVECLQSPITDLPRPLIALETSPHAESCFKFRFPPQCCIALGNEEWGCSEKILEQADSLVRIPLRGYKNSLNVANAFAIAASIMIQQHGGKLL